MVGENDQKIVSQFMNVMNKCSAVHSKLSMNQFHYCSFLEYSMYLNFLKYFG